MKKIAIILGNGKSLQPLVDDKFKSIPDGVETYGTSLAFRYYEKINWWPTYYGALDPKIVDHHKETFQRFLLDETNPVKKWYLCDNWCKEYFKDPYKKLVLSQHNVTGYGCTLKAIDSKKYDEIWLIGIDNTYKFVWDWVEKVGTMKGNDNRVRFIKDIEDNPNYAIPYYLQKGDIFSFEPRTKNNEVITNSSTNKWATLYEYKNIFDYCSYNNLKFTKKEDIIKDLKSINNL